MRYALIGCGRISPNHIAAALDNGLEIVAICDVVESQMDDTIKRFNLDKSIKKYTDYHNMIKEESLDLVAICTESGKHGEIGIECANAGINLIIEKPIALSLDEVDEIIRIAQVKNIVVSACHQNRFNKSVQKLRSAVEKGQFGKLFHGTAHIRWNRGPDYYSKAPWRGTWDQDGGALMNQCIHNIDLLRWMMGDDIDEVMGVTANLNHDGIEAEDLGLAIVKFKNGSFGLIEGTTNVYPNNLEETLYIFGADGTVKIGGKSVNIIEEWQFKNSQEDPETVKDEFKENPPNVYGYGHNPLYKDVIRAIEKGEEPYVTAQDGRNALELVLAIYKASKEGKGVRLPMTGSSTMDFKVV